MIPISGAGGVRFDAFFNMAPDTGVITAAGQNVTGVLPAHFIGTWHINIF